jgi:hypothetical protein
MTNFKLPTLPPGVRVLRHQRLNLIYVGYNPKMDNSIYVGQSRDMFKRNMDEMRGGRIQANHTLLLTLDQKTGGFGL